MSKFAGVKQELEIDLIDRQLMQEHSVTNPYDEVPYASFPYRQTHPDRLATIATLMGLKPAPVDNCKVLELGCCSGGNLIPMACHLPGSQFVGIDASERQIADGLATVKKLDLANIQLLKKDILEVDGGLGTFDYIIVHGVYSWVPSEVRDKILTICRDNLAPSGVAYVSYNVLPGWHMRGIVRDIMLFRARCSRMPSDRIGRARSLIEFLAKSVSRENNPYGMLLNKELELLNEKEDSYLLHEYLEEHNEGIYFHQFAERAAAKELQYLGEADFGSMSIKNMPQQIEAVLHAVANDVVELEQYMDFVRNRMFRQTLLCHKNVRVDRNLRPERLIGLFLSSCARPESPVSDPATHDKVVFRGPSAVTTTSNPLMKAAMLHLCERWPLSVRFSDLLCFARAQVTKTPAIVDRSLLGPEARGLAESMVRCYATGQVELSSVPAAFSLAAPSPVASPLARIQAAHRNIVTNLKHESVQLEDLERRILCLLDGSRDKEGILDQLTNMVVLGDVAVNENHQQVQEPGRARDLLSQPVSDAIMRLASRALFV